METVTFIRELFLGINKVELILAIAVVSGLCMFWWLQISPHPFDLRDTLLDPVSGKTSQLACISWILLFFSMWVVVRLIHAGKDPTELVLGVLSIFIINRLGYQYVASRKGADISHWAGDWVGPNTATKTEINISSSPSPTKEELLKEYKDGQQKRHFES